MKYKKDLSYIAMVPARAGSKRVIDKNIQIIGEHPMIVRKVNQLLNCGVDKVYVGSDSDEILSLAEKAGAIPIFRAIEACNEDLSSANDMIKDFCMRVEGDIALWAHCTNPFLYAPHYRSALQVFNLEVLEQAKYDSVISVSKIQSHMWNHSWLPSNYDPYLDRHTLASEINPVYFQDGGIFIQSLEQMRANSYFFGKKPYLYIVEAINGYDINNSEELALAQTLAPTLDAHYD